MFRDENEKLKLNFSRSSEKNLSQFSRDLARTRILADLWPGSHQWIRCPHSQSDPGKLQHLLAKPFEKKQIPSSSDINERDRRWPEDHRDAGPSDREVQFLVPKSTVQSETLESDVEERRSVSFFLVQAKHPRLRGTEKTRCPWFSKFWEILSRRAPELETVLLS